MPSAAEKRSVLTAAGIAEEHHKHYTLLSSNVVLEGDQLVHRPTGFTKKTIASLHRWMLQYSLIRLSNPPGAKKNKVYVCVPPLHPIWK